MRRHLDSPPGLRIRGDAPSILVFGLGYGGLNAVRSLARLGGTVDAVHRNTGTPAATSRMLRSLHVCDIAAEPAAATVEWLRSLGERLDRPVCVLLDDAEALFFARHRTQLQDVFRYPFVSPDVVEPLIDKARLHDLCKAHGAPTPRSAPAVSFEAARAFAGEVGYPLVVKGKATFGPEAVAAVTLVQTDAELARVLLRSEGKRPTALLQEHLPDQPRCNWIFHGYFDSDSHCRFGMTAVKLLQHPHTGGRTVVAAAMPNRALEETASDFLSGIGYQGVVDCDYRYDPRDGTYKLLDANPRVGANFRVSVDSAGMDVVRSLYFDLTGDRRPLTVGRVNRRWLLETDFPATRSYVRAGELTTRQWLGTLRGVQELAWVSPSDVRPFVAFVRARMSESGIVRGLRDVAGRRRPA